VCACSIYVPTGLITISNANAIASIGAWENFTDTGQKHLELLPSISEIFPGPLSVIAAVERDTAVWVLPRSHVLLHKLLQETMQEKKLRRKLRREEHSQSKESNVFGASVRLEIPRKSILVFR